jgi:hypothetical protein
MLNLQCGAVVMEPEDYPNVSRVKNRGRYIYIYYTGRGTGKTIYIYTELEAPWRILRASINIYLLWPLYYSELEELRAKNNTGPLV